MAVVNGAGRPIHPTHQAANIITAAHAAGGAAATDRESRISHQSANVVACAGDVARGTAVGYSPGARAHQATDLATATHITC